MSAAGGENPGAAVRAKLGLLTGRKYWRGLEELYDEPGFRQRLEQEFPALARLRPDFGADVDRRSFFKCVAGAIALAGLDGCERGPDEDAYPYVNPPEGVAPGQTRYYATAFEIDGVGQPVIGKCRDGRPIKLEGNPDHPASGGATDAFTQAALLGLYDPDRSASPLFGGEPATWDDFAGMAFAEGRRLDAAGGAGLRLLTGPVNSPTLLRQIAEMRARWPQLRWHVHEPLGGGFASAAQAAKGRPLERRLRLENAHAIVCLDDDPLGPGPLQNWHARGWSARRRGFQAGDGAAMLLVAEPTPTLTGVAAGERLVAGHHRIGALLAALAGRLGVASFGGAPPLASPEHAWVDKAASALDAQRGRGLLTVGSQQPGELQQLGLAINAALGNLGRTIELVEPAPGGADGDLAALASDMAAGAVETLIVLDSNPAYSAPADLDFPQALGRVAHTVHAGLHVDETAKLCRWHAPLTHGLESWSDTRAADGSACLVQPLVRPFLDVRSRHAVLSAFLGPLQDDRGIVRATWLGGGGDESRWQDALVRGFVAGSAAPPSSATPAAAPAALPAPPPDTGLVIVFRTDPTVHDGSFASNPWLQEMPKPLTKLTWDNAVHIAPALADELAVANGDVVEVAAGGRSVRGAVWIVPGQERRTVLLHTGYGRRAGSRVAQGCGFDANLIRSNASPSVLVGASLHATGDHLDLACTQTHWAMAGHDFIRSVANPADALPEKAQQPSFYPPQRKTGPAWGMAIDLDLCIGCNACAVACVAENNVPTVGKEQVAKGREMHWLRIDRYYEGSVDEPALGFQPVPCMHCEDAPCEMGCPVNATVHSPDGLNLQVYNRCIGTRTCSAYCPYKVRRFNWLDYTRDAAPAIQAQRNPDVTVRDRGVMEKCTYCIQRISEARIDADNAGTPIPEGAVRTACQQACPTEAIVFGDIARGDSAVSLRKASGRDYSLIEEANTRPRTTYGAKIDSGGNEA